MVHHAWVVVILLLGRISATVAASQEQQEGIQMQSSRTEGIHNDR